jgi:hypothetical protein
VGQHAGINTTSKNIYGWVNMQEWWVNMNRNGGSTWSGIYNYPELTPYQFASNRPIDGIDLDGLEYTRGDFEQIQKNAKALLTNNLISGRGFSNALLNANTLGLSDLLGGTDNVDDYSKDADKKTYLLGRVLGDVAAGLQGLAEIAGAATGGGASGALAATGVGAPVAVVTGTGSAIVGGHGVAVGSVAAVDLGQTLAQLNALGVSLEGSTSNNTPNNNTNPTSQRSASDQKLIDEAIAAQEKEAATQNRVQQRKKASQRGNTGGNSNQDVRGSHHTNKSGGGRHDARNERAKREQANATQSKKNGQKK